METHLDVAIAGYGPGGAIQPSLLREQGRRVAVPERSVHPTDQIKVSAHRVVGVNRA
jgi:2-polyprenyl-6-methoxyphenol hydroxylase-like FAD-dependent oxidoreductase